MISDDLFSIQSSFMDCPLLLQLQVLTKENVSENQSVREFFSSLVTDHLDKTLSGARLDFLACNLMLHTDGGGLDKELESFVGVSTIQSPYNAKFADLKFKVFKLLLKIACE